MITEAEVRNRFDAYLKSLGYPEEAIIQEWNITDRQRLDLAIIDPKSKQLIALFEIKNGVTTLASAKEQIKNYAQAIGDTTIPLFIVLGEEDAPFFKLFSIIIENGKEQLHLINQLPSFTSLRNGSISKKIIQTVKEKRKTFDGFKITCWLLAFVIIGLLFFDFKGSIKLTPERLGVIAIISGLIVLPFARKLNILGVEFERLQDKSSAKE
jgi:hypothetical protein